MSRVGWLCATPTWCIFAGSIMSHNNRDEKNQIGVVPSPFFSGHVAEVDHTTSFLLLYRASRAHMHCDHEFVLTQSGAFETE